MSNHLKEVRGRTKIPVEECNFIWSIENFSLCKINIGESLLSPIFTTGSSFLTTWHLTLYPNGRKKEESEGKVGIYLTRESNDTSSHFAIFKISFLTTNETELFAVDFEHLYDKPKSGWGAFNMIDRKTLLGTQRATLLPNDILRVKCNLRVNRLEDDAHSECDNAHSNSCKTGTDLQVLSNDLRELYEGCAFTDFMLRVGDEEIPVHKCILSARSPVFANMLKHDMKEKLTNCAEIGDMDPLAAKMMVNYLYCGQVEDLTTGVSIELYSAAEKYQLRDLKKMCVDFLLSHISTTDACDILLVGYTHDDLDLISASRNFIFMNAVRVQKTDKWLDLSSKKPDLVLNLIKDITAHRMSSDELVPIESGSDSQ